jgi:hypothetical protein
MRLVPALPLALALSLSGLTAAHADDISDALQAASDAYSAGNLKDTSDKLALAAQAIRAKEIELLNAFLPPAPDGYTSEVSTDYAQSFGMIGGGSGTEISYSSDAASFKLDITVDNAMVASMAPMLSNAAIMTAMGKVDQIGEQLVLEEDQSLTTLVANRILVQMQGADVAVMLPLMQKIDFAGLAKFDQK